MSEVSIPNLNIDILKRIVSDAVKKTPYIEAVGCIGSYARGTQTTHSDVDLIVKCPVDTFSEVLETFGGYIERVLYRQFDKRLDIVNYHNVQKRAYTPPNDLSRWYYQDGYMQMLKDVKWLYER